jgi:anti-sigma factor RsiW
LIGSKKAFLSMTSCRESINLLLEYLDGGLEPGVRARLEEHFGGCTPCEEFLASYRETPEVCRLALATKMPETIAHKLRDFLRSEIGTAPRSLEIGEPKKQG